MKESEVLFKFFDRIKEDAVIDTRHIALFMILFKRWLVSGNSPIQVKGDEVMREAKISSSATYISKLHYLKKKGYLKYSPSTYSKKQSLVDITQI